MADQNLGDVILFPTSKLVQFLASWRIFYKGFLSAFPSSFYLR